MFLTRDLPASKTVLMSIRSLAKVSREENQLIKVFEKSRRQMRTLKHKYLTEKYSLDESIQGICREDKLMPQHKILDSL